jgi:DNA-binding transcriptional MerR regulator
VVSGEDERSYAIGEVAAILGVPAPTIRSWERRHDLPVGERTQAGHRRYRASDVLALQRLQNELAAGRRVAEAAGIVKLSLTAPPVVLTEQLCAAAHSFDPAAITAVLDQARTVYGLTAALQLVTLPALRELGDQWAAGSCDVAHEHLATAAIQGWLRTAAQEASPPPPQDPVVLACAPGEQHTLALDGFAVLLAHAGVRYLNLGAQVPAASLEQAVLSTGARAVVLSCHLHRNRRAATSALQTVAGGPAAVYYAGAAFSTQAVRRGVPGRYLGEDLGRAVQRFSHSGCFAATDAPDGTS